VSTSTIQTESFVTDWQLDNVYDAPSRSSVADASIDDPVNDTGLGPRRGDLQLADEFACLITLICEGSGEIS